MNELKLKGKNKKIKKTPTNQPVVLKPCLYNKLP